MSHGHHSPFIQHHYEGPVHQFETGKFGIWAFLAQEILFFSALFVAYIVYRHQHPEIFDYAHHFLDPKLGGINTAVLIASSLTAAWSVRAAQLGQRKILIFCLAATICGALGFLGIKYIEYSHKVHIGVLFGPKFQPIEDYKGRHFPKGFVAPNSDTPPSPEPTMAELTTEGKDLAAAEAAGDPAHKTDKAEPHVPPVNTGMFFTIYFAMTGLHGIHVFVGLLVYIWLLIRAIKGHFTPEYYGPVDYSALYWHLVDLIWIFLFPMLYLIH
jgi:cytochrome c oxidase subunit 3